MGFRGLLRHQLAIVTPGAPDPDDLDEAGFPVAGADSVVLVPGLVQPRDSHEVREPGNEGVLYSDFIIFLEVMNISASSYITEADDNGPLEGGNRYQINGIQPFLFGSAPHLEVLATLIKSTLPLGLVTTGS